MASIKYENIFEVLSDGSGEESIMQLQADLMIVIRDIINGRDWGLSEISETLSISQLTLNDFLTGKIDRFSLGQLLSLLYKLGFRLKPIYKNNRLRMRVIKEGESQVSR